MELKNMDELLKYLANGKIVVYVSLACIAITTVMHLIFRKIRFVKYIPGFVFVLVGIFNLSLAFSSLGQTISLNYFSLSVVLLVGGLVGMLSALIIGVYNKPKKTKKKGKENVKEN
jgi:hypothetical protein